MTNKSLLEIIKSSKTLYNLSPIDVDDFPAGGGGGGDAGTGQGGSGGGTSGTTSGVIVPGLSISPSTDQTLAIGTTRCFNASGSISIPVEIEQNAVLNVGCSATSSGTWVKNCGTNGNPDSEAYNSTLMYRLQPFYIMGKNSAFVGATPGSPTNNSHLLIGVKSTGGYYFYWAVFKYCNATAGNCSSRWLASVHMHTPAGQMLTLAGGFVEFNQNFRVKSDGSRIIWEYTTYNNWAYNYYYVTIPEDSGDFQFFANGLWTNNTWTSLRTYRGSYQGSINPSDFIWTSSCSSNLEVDGNTACFTPTISGSCDICVSTLNTDPLCVTVVSSPLYIKPVGTDCNSCADSVDCLNIPDPETPSISLDSILPDSINVNWDEVISYTTGLYYELDVNGSVQTVLDNTVTLSSLPDGIYTIKVRAIDDCGASAWSNIEVITISSIAPPPPTPLNFKIVPVVGGYEAQWDPVVGAVNYHVWIGDPQTTYLISSLVTNVFLGNLFSGLKLSVKAEDVLGNQSAYSNVETVP